MSGITSWTVLSLAADAYKYSAVWKKNTQRFKAQVLERAKKIMEMGRRCWSTWKSGRRRGFFATERVVGDAGYGSEENYRSVQ